MTCAVIPWIFKWCRCTLTFHDILYLQVPFVHCAFQSDSLSGWVGWKAEGRRLNQTLSTWIWPQLILRGSISFCSSKIGWETALGLINLQQIRVDHGKKGWAQKMPRNMIKPHRWHNFTWLWFCKRTANAYHILNEQSLPSEDANIEMWIMNGNVIQSKVTLSAVEWVAPVRPLQRVRAGLLDFTFFFFFSAVDSDGLNFSSLSFTLK